ncbi:hypothetical protein PybrP1_002188, partial [[Pythium] brassicae (nom. inval.)]
RRHRFASELVALRRKPWQVASNGECAVAVAKQGGDERATYTTVVVHKVTCTKLLKNRDSGTCAWPQRHRCSCCGREAAAMATAKQIFNDLDLVLRLNQHIENIAGCDEATATLLTKQTSFKVLAELDSIKNPDLRADAQFEHQRFPETDCHGDDEDDGRVPPHLPFHLQGDQDFNRASAINERRALRRSEAIRRDVAFLWEVARGRKAAAGASRITSFDSVAPPRALGAAASRPTGNSSLHFPVIEEEDYVAMMLLIFKVLRDDFELDVAQLQVHCDWEVDSQHGNALGFDQFFAAVFELVDLWTCDIVEATYTRFLELLIRRITLRVVVFLDDMKLKLALSDNFDDAVVVKAIPLRTIQRFASVAKVLEGRGVRTVGELAEANPDDVERERLAYLEENNISKQKIGAELQHLLETFNGLTEQIGADSDSRSMYTLENMKLVRRLNTSGASAAAAGGATGSSVLVVGRGLGRVDPLEPKRGAGAPTATKGTTLSSSTPVAAALKPATTPSSPTLSVQASAAEALVDPRGGGRRLSIHDLSRAESGIINSLRSAFILEKHISIVRKQDMDGVRHELEKFGVDPTLLSDPEALERYGGLYEMFVLRDGESIRALAQTLMAQIKLELQSLGVDVDDEDAEDAYDGFYGSVVATSGEDIVKDAQSWVGDTLATKSAAPYIKADYHELKALEEVALVGSQVGDDEFVSLLSSDKEADDSVGGGDGDDTSDSVSAKPANGSPIQRKQSQVRAKQRAPPPIQTSFPSAERGGSQKHTKVERPPATPPRSPPSPRRRSGPHANPNSNDLVRIPPVDVDKQKKTGDRDDALSRRATHLLPSRLPDRSKRKHHASSPPPHATASPSVGDVVDANDIDGVDIYDLVEATGVAEPAVVSGNTGAAAAEVFTETYPAMQDGTELGSQPPVSLKASTSKANLSIETSPCGLEASDTVNRDLDRDAMGVAFGYDKVASQVLKSELLVKEIVAELVPKVPKIIVGPAGVEAANIPVTARYIQLLGLGTVLTVHDADGLYDLLRSEEGSDVDLVGLRASPLEHTHTLVRRLNASRAVGRCVCQVCFDIGSQLDTAVEKLGALLRIVGKRVIVLGGNVREPERTRAVVDECVALGAFYFATLPTNFPQLRTEILAFFESSEQPFILRQRRPSIAGGAAAAFRMASRSIGGGDHFEIHDLGRKLSTPPSYANIARSPRSRKPTIPGSPTAATTLPALPSVVKEVTSLIHLKALDDIRASEATAALAPSSPRSLKSFKKSSPRLSIALQKLMR